jgi:hypothetical protein
MLLCGKLGFVTDKYERLKLLELLAFQGMVQARGILLALCTDKS